MILRVRLAAAGAATVLTLQASVGLGQGLRAVRPLPGYACMMLNLTQEQMLDNSFVVPIRAAPSDSAAVTNTASGLVIAKAPEHVVNGYAEVLTLSNRIGWISARMLRPYQSASDPHATCTPSMMSNGQPGFGR